MKNKSLNSIAKSNNLSIENTFAVFGQRLTGRRKALQLSQRDLAKMVGVSVNTIQSYERGCLPRGSHFLALAKALRCSLNWLVGMNETGEFNGHAALPDSDLSGFNLSESTSGLDNFFIPPFIVDADEDASIYPSAGFNYQWLARLSSKPENVRLFGFKGSSMQPALSDGDILMVDLGRTSVHPGYLYLIKIDGVFSVNRLILKPDNYFRVLCDNYQMCPPFDLSAGQMEMIGRIIWVSRSL